MMLFPIVRGATFHNDRTVLDKYVEDRGGSIVEDT